MISITTKSPYALQALAELGRLGGAGPVPIGELARRRDIPVQFLEQLFAVLRRAGVLQIAARREGRLRFAREPREITVLEMVELLDGDVRRRRRGRLRRAADAARDVLGADDGRRRGRARGARCRRGDVLHLAKLAPDRVLSSHATTFPPSACSGRAARARHRHRHRRSRQAQRPPARPRAGSADTDRSLVRHSTGTRRRGLCSARRSRTSARGR